VVTHRSELRDPVSATELPQMFGVQPATVYQWRSPQRNVLPAPDYRPSNKFRDWLWERETLTTWGLQTGRLVKGKDGTVRPFHQSDEREEA
jgi:hypothetical protein